MSDKVMANLGGADGCVLRCLDILNAMQRKRGFPHTRYLKSVEWDELIDRLGKAHEEIIFAATEIEQASREIGKIKTAMLKAMS